MLNAGGKQARILVVDDEPQIQRALKSILAMRRYQVTVAGSGEEAIEIAPQLSPDLVILDLSMPGIGGLETCRELRLWLEAPILVLSVHGGVDDKIAALDLGADDYLTKPFATGELLARVRALLRRSATLPAPELTLKVLDLEIDLPRRRVTRAGEEIRLTRTEFDILAYLAQRADAVVSNRTLMQVVWGPGNDSDTQTLRVHMGHLRKKLEVHPSVPRYILTEPGVGYRLASS